MQLKLLDRSVRSVQSMHVCTWGHTLANGLAGASESDDRHRAD